MTLPRLRSARPVLFAALASVTAALTVCGQPARSAGSREPISASDVPTPRREFRGVWAASVNNIDWPSKPGLPVEQQQAELRRLLDRARYNNLNAILLQVRTCCDALYPSALEPWSEYLTGKQGQAPAPAWDPLQFAVTEAHKRGLELHAWFNPFRVRMDYSPSDANARPAAPLHVSRTHPDWVRQYGKMQWLDPGVKEARDYSIAVVMDVVNRYDVDGVHIDDYFYPYKITGPDKKEVDFPDNGPWQTYKAGGGKLSRSDWRRANIDDFVERMYKQVKTAKPFVKVGISPFGIWRPGYPAQIKGFDSYEQLYGDSRKWMHEGWADYFTPQLYWPIAQTAQSFPVLLNWWAGENVKGRHLWPGAFTSRAYGAEARWPKEEIEYQIRTTRGHAGSTGLIHFSAIYLLGPDAQNENGLASHLRRTVYTEPALVPASPWLGTADTPATPESLETVRAASPNGTGWLVKWKGGVSGAYQYLVQWRVPAAPSATAPTWNQALVAPDAEGFYVPASSSGPLPDAVAVSAINRAGVVGKPATAALP